MIQVSNLTRGRYKCPTGQVNTLKMEYTEASNLTWHVKDWNTSVQLNTLKTGIQASNLWHVKDWNTSVQLNFHVVT